MDEIIIKLYRRLLKEEFPYSGEIQNPSVFIEAVGEKLINCGNTGNYMHLFLQVNHSTIQEIRYLCSCEPVANVAVEILCSLVTEKSIGFAKNLTEEHFYLDSGSRDEKFQSKVRGVLLLLNAALERYSTQNVVGAETAERKNGGIDNLSWDGESPNP